MSGEELSVIFKDLLSHARSKFLGRPWQPLVQNYFTLSTVPVSRHYVQIYNVKTSHSCPPQQWRNVVALANMAPLGGKKAPPSGAPGIRAYWELFVKIWAKNLNR